MWRCVPLILILCLCAAPAFAQVPDATIQHIVELNVKAAEIRYLHDSGQIDEPTWRDRRDATQSELNALWQSTGRFSAAEQNHAQSQTDSLTKLRLETLQPGWDAKIAVAQKQREQHNRIVNDAIPVDARAALELQRRRLSLQQRRDHGEITPEEFAVEDKKAFDDILAVRNKYVPEGQQYLSRFDSQLAQLTQAMPKNPVIPPSAPNDNGVRDKAAQGGTTAADYRHDVAEGAAMQYRLEEAAARLNNKEIDDPTYEAVGKTVGTDITRLYFKWAKVGKGDEWERDYRRQLASMPHPVRPTAQPAVTAAQGNKPMADISGPDYKRDVEEAAKLQFQRGQFAQRYLDKEIDANAYDKAMKGLGPRLGALQAKWKAAGRQTAFQSDYMKQVTVLAVAAKSPMGLLRHYLVTIILIVIAGIVGIYLLIKFPPKKGEPDTSGIYGTAHYAPTQLDVVDDACLARGVFFGKSSAPELARLPLDSPGAPVCSTPEHHTLIVARTRTGKGTRVIVPTLLRYGGSAFVIDPKGENAAVTARIRRDQLHQNIHVLNPWNELGETFQSRNLPPATYNPLDILDRSDPNAVAVAQTLAAAICPAPASGKDPYWQVSAGSILTAVFLWLAECPTERKTLARAREIVSLSRTDFTEKHVIPMAASEAFSGAIREMAAPFIGLAADTYSGVMSNLSVNTRFLSDPQVKTATATSSFSMNDLATQKTTVYVVIPADRMDTQRIWLRLVVASAMHAFKRPRKRSGSHHRCLFLIDEFAALGRVDDMPRDLATMAGFGVDFALAVQGLDQLKDHYGKAWDTILNNCAYQWFCNLNDLESAKYLSDVLGKKTVVTTSTSDSTSAPTSGGGAGSSSHSTSHGETGRNLLNPDEILTLGKGVAILIQPKRKPEDHPHYLRPVDYWNLPTAFGSLREKHPSLYWDPPFNFDENPYADPGTPPPPPGSDKQKARSKEKARTEPSPRQGKMTVEQARDILEVKAGATFEEIHAAFLRLMSKYHPDHGGTNHFARELIDAKAVLIGE